MIFDDSDSREPNPQKKYLSLGYGNHRGQPNPQIGGGYIRNTDMLEKFLQFLGSIEEKPKDNEQETNNH
jgi:hypothetical protein